MSRKERNRWNWDELRDLSEEMIEEKANDILGSMELKDKVYQMAGDISLVRGSVPMLIRYNSKPIPAGHDKKLGIEGMKFSDGPRGIVMGASTCFPVSMARGASWDIDLEERIGNAIGIEGRAQGANYFGGVCINLLRHPAWGRAQETYGEDTFHLGEFGVALTKGIQNHMMACAKHYALNSMENARFKVSANIDERTLREVYLNHFRKCVEAGVASIMNAYNKVNGIYCGHNEHLLRDILKNDWGFKGFVITDFLLGIRDGRAAVHAGVDIEMPFHWRMKPKKLIRYVKKEQIPLKYIDEAVFRILSTKLRFNRRVDLSDYSMEKVACEEHIQLSLEAARKGMVLLKNENKILPLNKKEIKKIAVIGKLADMANLGDFGSSRVYPSYVITPLEGIRKSAGVDIKVTHVKDNKIEEIAPLIKDSDNVIIVVGYTHKNEGEFVFSKGGDRTSLTLRPEDEELISSIAAINKNCIVVLEGGSAIITEVWRDKVAGIIMAWYPGMEGGTALGEIIFGETNPSGKLPMVFPKSSDQLPFFDKNARSIEYGYYHGYKLMDKEGWEPAFPFGFGLSYTSYSYNNLKLDKETISKDGEVQISVDITNTGDMAGEEICQLYIGYNNSSVERAVKDLKGFTKIQLNPGESKTVNIRLKAEDLAYYDIEKTQWIVEPIEYIVYIGPSSQKEDLLTITFKIS